MFKIDKLDWENVKYILSEYEEREGSMNKEIFEKKLQKKITNMTKGDIFRYLRVSTVTDTQSQMLTVPNYFREINKRWSWLLLGK